MNTTDFIRGYMAKNMSGEEWELLNKMGIDWGINGEEKTSICSRWKVFPQNARQIFQRRHLIVINIRVISHSIM